jgi:hypothetical protein
MKADRIRGLARLGDECESVGRQIARLLQRADELANNTASGCNDPVELDEAITEARRFVRDGVLAGIGNQLRPAFRKAIER